jgi:hypothetical protein
MDIDTIKLHFAAMSIIPIRTSQSTTGGLAEFIDLTDLGRSTLMEIMAVRSNLEQK